MAEKTEQPTPKKLRDARKKGQVASSKEVVSATVVLSVMAWLWMLSDFYLFKFQQLMLLPADFTGAEFHYGLQQVVNGGFIILLQLVIPLLAMVVLVVILAHFFQFGLLFSAESIKPSLKKLNPLNAIKKIVSIKNLMELIKSFVKIIFLSILMYLVIRLSFRDLVEIPVCGENCILPILGLLLEQIMLNAAVVFIIIAALDLVFQRYQHTKQLRMSKDEVKQEYKEMEGDPMIKSKRRHLHQELLNESITQSVKKATVIVTNPTHIAVAIEYRDGETPLPIVRAKGQNLIAKRIVEIAKQEGIPIMQNVPLARALHEQSEVDRYIPSDLIEAVAEVLRWVEQVESQQ